MKQQRNAIKAGLFIIISIALIVGVIIAIGGGVEWGQTLRHRIVSFRLSDDLGGLRVGDDVRLGGYKVGVIDRIEPKDLTTAEPKVLVNFELPNQYTLREDAVLGVQITLTGTTCINIESLGSPARPEATGPLAGTPDPKTVLLTSLGPVGKDFAVLTQNLRNNTIPKVNFVLDSVKSTSDQGATLLHHVDGQIDPLVTHLNDATTKASMVLDNFHEITEDVKVKLPSMLAKVDTALDTARQTLVGLQQTADNAREISTSVRSVISGNRSKLDGMIADFKTTGDNLKAASVEIRHSPWRLLYQPSNAELTNLNTFDAARQFSEGANELNNAAQALRDASTDKSADPKRIQQLMDHLDESFKNFHEVEQKLWTGVKE